LDILLGMHSRLSRLSQMALLAAGTSGLLVALQACSDDTTNDSPEADSGVALDGSGRDATSPPVADGGVDVRDSAKPDVTPPSDDGGRDADADAATETADATADADATVDATADASGDADAGPPQAERVTPAGCPIGLGIGTSTLYWTETSAYGCYAAVRSCPTTGCATLPPPIYLMTTPNQSSPNGTVVASGAPDRVFYTDGQLQSADLWKLQPDGGGTRTAWGTSTVTPRGGVTDGTSVFWGSGYGVYRSAVATAGATLVLSGSPSSNAPQSIAVDATNVYATIAGKLMACPKAADCTNTGGTTAALIANVSGVQDVASDGTNVYFTAADATHTRIYRCSITGCPGGTPTLFAETVTTLPVEQFGNGIAITATDVYWGTNDGAINVCPKSATAPCTPTPWVQGARPVALVQDTTHIYWSDLRGGIYRIVKR
jgi:hypothetical protein